MHNPADMLTERMAWRRPRSSCAGPLLQPDRCPLGRFLNRTSRPPPFSSMESTPAASKAGELLSRFLLSLPELRSHDLNRPFRNLTPGRFPFVNSTPARVSTVSITARLSGSPAYRPTSILLIVFR